jgi:glycine cleavage system H lipoate-binding protein
MDVPEGLKYTREHEWIKVEGNTGRVGITHYAQDQLGDMWCSSSCQRKGDSSARWNPSGW